MEMSANRPYHGVGTCASVLKLVLFKSPRHIQIRFNLILYKSVIIN